VTTVAAKPIRSPSYPNAPLSEAIGQVRKIETQYRLSPVDRVDAAKLIGYSSLSGPASAALSSLAHYGLVERAGKGEMRVTALAQAILHPDGESEKRESLRRAAFEPALFRELHERFPNMTPPMDGIITYLNRQGFNQTATKPAARAYLQTLSFLEEAGANESHGASAAQGAESASSVDEQDALIYGGAQVGDLIQWESSGTLQLEKPTRVRWISDDSQWVAVDGSDTGIPMSEVLVHERAPSTPPPIPAAALTKAQEAARTPGVGPVSGAQMANLPPLGWTQAVFPLADGPVFLNFPDDMSADGYAELKEYLAIFLRRAERAKRQQETPGDQGSGPEIAS
jgi:hypothetical protein